MFEETGYVILRKRRDGFIRHRSWPRASLCDSPKLTDAGQALSHFRSHQGQAIYLNAELTTPAYHLDLRQNCHRNLNNRS